MPAKERLCDFLFYMLVGLLYAFALTRAVFNATILQIPDSRLLLLCAGFLPLFYAVLWNRATILAVSGAAVVAGAAVFFSLWRQQFEAAWYIELTATFRELMLFAQDRAPYRAEYDRLLTLAVSGAVSLLTALCLRPRLQLYLLAVSGAAVLFTPLYMDWGEYGGTVPLYLFCLLVALTKKLNLNAVHREKGRGRQNAVFALTAIPLCALAGSMAWALPKPANLPSDPITAPGGTPRNIIEAADDLLGGSLSGGRTVAYTEDGSRLGGPNTLGNQFVMEVACAERVYLSGSVRDRYTGSAWEASSREQQPLEPDESGVFQASEYSSQEITLQDYYQRFYAQNRLTVTVNTRDNRTATVFSPPFRRSLSVEGGAENVRLRQNGLGALSLERALPAGTPYSQPFIAWDYNNRYIAGLLREAARYDDAAAMAPWLTLPDTLPQRVRDLARDITGEEANDYDKLVAIARYLAVFPYTLAPDSVPRGEDFVDYFLFTGQEGYCVYYASALAVLARCADIPTRYVEGFVMPSERNEDGNFTVTGQQAHAWAEAYFPGFGWVPVESTPPNYIDGSGESVESSEPPPQTEESSPPAPPPPEESGPTAPTTPAGRDRQENGGPGKALLTLLTALLALAGAAALAVRLLARRYRLRAAALEALPNREAAEAYFSRLLGAAAALDFPPLENETAHAWAARTGGRLNLPEGATAGELADIFARASYSRQEVTDHERAAVESAYYALLDRLRNTGRRPLLRLSRLWDRYVRLRF